jgi:transposase
MLVKTAPRESGDGGDMGIWTDEEIRTLVSMWPTNSVMKIAKRLNRRRETIYAKAKWLHKKGVLEDKDFPRSRPINPDPQDFDEVKRDYCRKHHITVAELCARLERDTQFAAELYRLAQVVKQTRLIDQRAADGKANCPRRHVAIPEPAPQTSEG